MRSKSCTDLDRFEDDQIHLKKKKRPDDESFSTCTRTNPFLLNNDHHHADRNKSANGVDKNADSVFTRISDSNGEIVKLHLMSSKVRPGDTVIGLLDFSDASSSHTCTQYCVSLIGLEKVVKKPKLTPKRASNESRTVHAATAEVCVGFDTSSFELFIPADLTPSFASETVKLQWILRFEFVLAEDSEAFNAKSSALMTWKAPRKFKVRTRKWETTLQICKPTKNV